MILASCLAAFAAGAFVDGTAVFWVHFSERGRAIPTGAVAMLQAIAQVVGIGESVRDWATAPFFVVGYGLGAAVAVRWKGSVS